MSDTLTGDAKRPLPAPIDLGGIDRRHPDHEDTLHLLGTTVAETAAGVTGVHHLGGLAARTLDRARRQVLGTSSAPGVNVAREDGTMVIDLDIVVEYPHAVSDVIDATRIQVTRAAAQIVSGPVVVDITVTDVHGPFDRDPAILDAIDTAGDKARDLKDQAVDKAGDLKDQAVDKAADLKDQAAAVAATASDKADELKKQAVDAVGDLTEQAGDVAEQARTRSGELREDAADATERAGAAVSDFAARAIDKVADFQERAQDKVDEASVEAEAPDTALDRQLDELEEHAESKLDELGAVAEEKLDELDEAADRNDAPKIRPDTGDAS